MLRMQRREGLPRRVYALYQCEGSPEGMRHDDTEVQDVYARFWIRDALRSLKGRMSRL